MFCRVFAQVSVSGAGDSRERVRRYYADYTFDSALPVAHPDYASQEKVQCSLLFICRLTHWALSVSNKDLARYFELLTLKVFSSFYEECKKNTIGI